MLKRRTYQRSLISDGWTSFDPVDGEVIERLFKKEIREREEALMLAVLENAIEYFQKYVVAQSQREKRLFKEAEEWILEKNSDWFFSFENICETLELYPDYIRQGLMRWKEAKCRSVQPQQPEPSKRLQPKLLVRTG
ncbi:MAG TPA: hypothetical protein VHJ56_09630 [Candidatus Binatia bacterium]|jgi:hypothetical protein|nr:hypothetical protein [Candidatus Binatia bacterium]